MPTPTQFKGMLDYDLLLYGKEALVYPEEFTIALLERFEAVLEELAEAEYSHGDEVAQLENQITDLLGENNNLCVEISELERELDELRAEITNTHS